jgi:hypothetical protein
MACILLPVIKIKPHEINYYTSHFIFATASFAQSTISEKVVEKENLLQEQTYNGT